MYIIILLKNIINMSLRCCRYNVKHKFINEELLLKHEAICPTKAKRTDLIQCLYTNKHILYTYQYKNHIKHCKYRPRTGQKKSKLEESQEGNPNNIKVTVINIKKTANIENNCDSNSVQKNSDCASNDNNNKEIDFEVDF